MNNYILKKLFYTKVLLFLLLFFHCAFSEAFQAESLIHVHSAFSTGNDSIVQILEKSNEKGVKVVFMTDHDVIRVEYGLFPFRNILKKSYELESVTRKGASEYIEECGKKGGIRDDIVVIPGVESTAYYFWSGNPFDGTLTANNWQKHILVIGFHNAEEIENLPVIHNGLSLRYFRKLFPRSLIFIAALLFSFMLYGTGGKKVKMFSLCASFISLLLIINYHPFKSSLFTQYEKASETAPYQELIDYANEKNLLTVWAHPESYREREIEGVKMVTPKYAEGLPDISGFTAFEGLYRDNSYMINPGKEWDIILQQFLNGDRNSPVWAVGGIDYHGGENEEIDEVETVFLIDSLSEENVLEALRKGRCYARRKSASGEIFIKDFVLSNTENNAMAETGETLLIGDSANLTIRIDEKNGNKVPCALTVVKNGEVFMMENISTPYEETFGVSAEPEEKGYFRIMINTADGGKVVSNPIFFNVQLAGM